MIAHTNQSLQSHVVSTACHAALLLAWFFGANFVGPCFAANTTIGSGDLLQVRVFGDASGLLSGPFRVQADGTIDFPILGRIDVRGKSVEDANKLLTASLNQQKIHASAYILISEYAPVFVMGDVGRTGPFPYRPGLTIFDVVAEMGGLPISGDFRTQIASAERETADLEFLEFSLTVQRARLQAEISQREFNVEQFAGRDTDDERSAVRTQKSIFDAHRRSLTALKESLSAQQRTYEQETESLHKSISLHDQEVSSLEEQVLSQQALAEKGLVTQSRVLEISRELSVTRREALEFRTALFRAEQNRLLTLQKKEEAEPSAEMINLDLLAKVESDLSRTRLSLLATRSTLASIRVGETGSRTSLGRTAIYTIIRTTDAGRTEQVVGETFTLERGDIIRVEMPNAEFGSVVSSAGNTIPRNSEDSASDSVLGDDGQTFANP